METHYRPEDEVTQYYAGTFTTSHQSPLAGHYTGTYYDSSSLVAVGAPYGMSLETLNAPTPGLMPSPIWSSIPEEDLSFQELLSPPGLQSASLPLAKITRSVQKKSTTRRRILSDEKRQAIRIYHEENKTAQHSKIAGNIRALHSSDLFCRRNMLTGILQQHCSEWKEGTPRSILLNNLYQDFH
jgi:hypothetical protein